MQQSVTDSMGSNELQCAYRVGMYPVLILPEKDAEAYSFPDDEIKEFAKNNGSITTSVQDVLPLTFS